MVTAEQAILADGPGPRAGTARRGAFFVWSAAALAVLIFAGFAPSFYLRPWLPGRPLPTLVLLHGIVFSLWPVLFVLQTVLVASGRTPLHRTLGVAGTVLAAAMLVLGTLVTIEQVERVLAFGLPPGFPAIGFVFAVSMIGIVAFAGLVAAAVYYRRRPDTHKRLMLAATALISAVGIGRLLPFVMPAASPTFLIAVLLADLFLVALVWHDFTRLGKPHPATLWGAAVTVASQVAPFVLGQVAVFNAAVTSVLS
jgi:hypothetical protein